MTAPQLPTFVDPSFGDQGPSTAELAGRLIAVIPTAIDHQAAGYEPGSITTAVTFDVYVIDGGPLAYGARPKKNQSAQFSIATPAFFRGQLISNENIVRALAPHVGKGVAVLGRIVQSTVGQRPWNLEALAPTDPGRQLVAQFFGALASGQYTLPEPVALQQAQPVAPAPQQFAPPPAQPQFAAPIAAPQPMPPQYTVPVAVPVAAPAEQLPPGMTPEFWATLSDAQKQMMLASQAQAAAPQQQPANPF